MIDLAEELSTSIRDSLIKPEPSGYVPSLNYFSPNMRGYESVRESAQFYDEMLRDGKFMDNINHIRHKFNLTSEYFDPVEVLRMIGAGALVDVVSEDIKAAVAVVFPLLLPLRGTQQALEVALRFIGIDWEKIYFLRTRSGRSRINIKVSARIRLTDQQILVLNILADMLLPFCVILDGITNCASTEDADENPWVTDITLGLLDYNFKMGRTKMGARQGRTLPGSSITILLCSPDITDMWDLAQYIDGKYGEWAIRNKHNRLKRDERSVNLGMIDDSLPDSVKIPLDRYVTRDALDFTFETGSKALLGSTLKGTPFYFRDNIHKAGGVIRSFNKDYHNTTDHLTDVVISSDYYESDQIRERIYNGDYDPESDPGELRLARERMNDLNMLTILPFATLPSYDAAEYDNTDYNTGTVTQWSESESILV